MVDIFVKGLLVAEVIMLTYFSTLVSASYLYIEDAFLDPEIVVIMDQLMNILNVLLVLIITVLDLDDVRRRIL